MGKRSVKENKTVWQTSREECGLTREKASELLGYISADRIEKIESEKVSPHPEEAMTMAQVYRKPFLRNYYCTNECPIGQKYEEKIEEKPISQITLELLNSINLLYKEKEKIISISLDGTISADEVPDFLRIREELEQISSAVDTLQIWMEGMMLSGKLSEEVMQKLSQAGMKG